MTIEDAVRVSRLTKVFGATTAVDHVDWSIRRGEVHALLGENGAGKSTLCSMLAGVYRPDAGEIHVDGHRRHFASPRDALADGIGMVFQEFRLLKRLTVAENLALASPGRRFLLRRRTIELEAAEAAERFGMSIDPTARVADLSIGEQQRIEILRLLMRNTSVLMLDEPTSVLTPQESEVLFENMRTLAAGGCSVVFVSHKLEEVCAAADRITVLRDGQLVAQSERGTVEPHELARVMVGREVSAPTRPASATGTGEIALSLDEVSARGDRGRRALDRVSFDLRRGEILGIAGVAGNGQRELAETIAGLRPATSGQIRWGLDRRDITHADVRARSRLGLAYVPDDRIGTAIAAGLPGWINMSLRDFDRPEFARGPFVRTRKLRSNADRLARDFDVRGHMGNGQARHLSGGNIQRLVLARELEHDPAVMIAASPTRGLDVGAVVATHQLIYRQCEAGLAALVMSEDLDELLTICRRVLVLFEGRVMGEFVPGEIDVATIGSMMAGRQKDAETAAQPVAATGHRSAEDWSSVAQ